MLDAWRTRARVTQREAPVAIGIGIKKDSAKTWKKPGETVTLVAIAQEHSSWACIRPRWKKSRGKGFGREWRAARGELAPLIPSEAFNFRWDVPGVWRSRLALCSNYRCTYWETKPHDPDSPPGRAVRLQEGTLVRASPSTVLKETRPKRQNYC